MRKDFSEASKEHFKSIVRSVESEKLCDFTDWLGDRIYDFQAWIGNLQIGNYLDDLDRYHKKIIDKNNTTTEQIDKIFNDVYDIDESYSKSLSSYRTTNLTNELYFIKRLSTILDNITNPAFDRDGQYGGYQGSPEQHSEDLSEIVRKYYPDYTQAQIDNLLSELREHGCGYVALCNTLFAKYSGHEDDFEKKFGFPMYVDGELNYDALIVDLFCSSGNYNGDKTEGTTNYKRKKMWIPYLKKHGINVEVNNDLEITTSNFYQYYKSGQVIISVHPCILENKDGNIVYQGKSDGGHAMTVTGVTDDGRFVVSSWGRTYYVKPDKKYKHIYFQQVIYK